jgi:hypothetical protein
MFLILLDLQTIDMSISLDGIFLLLVIVCTTLGVRINFERRYIKAKDFWRRSDVLI